MKYQVTCDEKCYDLASQFLEDHNGLHTHAKANELGGVIQRAIDEWIADAVENLAPETT